MKTLLAVASLALVLPQAVDRPAEQRSLSFSVTDAKGTPLPGLVREEVAVLENGVAREVTRLDRDARPLTLALLVDTSEAASSHYRLQVLDPLLAFLGKLPEGSRFAVWTTGDRPTKLVDYTSDVASAAAALRRVAPQGGNTLLDAIVEASADLKKKEGARSVVLAVTNLGPEFSSYDRFQVADLARGNADVFHAVQYDEAENDIETRQRYGYVFDDLTRRSGGLDELTMSAMGVAGLLQRVGAEIRGQYRLTYATVPDLKERKLQVSVARAGVKVRAPQAPER
jgi:VWFA-related protein